MAVITCKGFSPYEHQKAVIEEVVTSPGTNKTVVCKSSRQKGKTHMCANLLLYQAINFAKTKNYCVSPTLKQSKAIYKTIIDAIGSSGIVKARNGTDLHLTLINGSYIAFKSAEQREALRGFTADFLIIDEAAFIPDDIFYLILPWTDAKKATLLMTSTPFTKTGFFWDYYNYGLNGQNNTVTVDWSDEKYEESIRKILSLERLEEYRRILPANVFKTEYLGEWLDGDGMVFTNIQNCLKSVQIAPGDKLYFGIDWCNQGENDFTVLTAFNQHGNQVYLNYWNNLSPLGQIDTIYQQLVPWMRQIQTITCETNSIGTPYTELLKQKSQIVAQKVVGFNTSNTSKNELVVNTQYALENGEITLLPDEKLKREFGYFTATYNAKTRVVTYAAPGNLHDDVVMASMFAYDGYKKKTGTATYAVSFRNTRKRHDRS